MCSFTAAGTAYSNYGVEMIPFYIFYSMFGFQRIGDFVWAFAERAAEASFLRRDLRPHDAQRRRVAAQDATASYWRAPCDCLSYDPAFAYEIP